jgi:hypothetical protein
MSTKSTIRIRIAVAVDSGGEWNACGWGGRDQPYDPESMTMARRTVGSDAAQYWVEAEVPIPELCHSRDAVEIDGEVESSGDGR